MHECEHKSEISEIYSLLNRIGITSNYLGYYYIAHAVLLSIHQPKRLVRVTKWIYPAVAKYYETSVYAVERNIRTVVNITWFYYSDVLEQVFETRIKNKPGNAQFLAIVTSHMIANH